LSAEKAGNIQIRVMILKMLRIAYLMTTNPLASGSKSHKAGKVISVSPLWMGL
jgi:hypothetical protein